MFFNQYGNVLAFIFSDFFSELFFSSPLGIKLCIFVRQLPHKSLRVTLFYFSIFFSVLWFFLIFIDFPSFTLTFSSVISIALLSLGIHFFLYAIFSFKHSNIFRVSVSKSPSSHSILQASTGNVSIDCNHTPPSAS